MIKPKKGLKLVGRSELGARHTQAEVTNVTKTKITVEVERIVRGRNGTPKIEKRTRELTPGMWHFFVLGYTQSEPERNQ